MNTNNLISNIVISLIQNINYYLQQYILQIRRGFIELKLGFINWRLWHLMGTTDLRRRYARSRLGQLWIMLSSLISTTIMGLVWSLLWNQPVEEMLPFVAVGSVVWQLFSGILAESTNVFQANCNFFHNQFMPVSTAIIALIYRHTITFLLNILFPIILLYYFNHAITYRFFLLIPGLFILVMNCLWMSFLIGIICSRFRDMIQIINSLLQLAMYVTPVVWKPELLTTGDQKLLLLNPLFAVTSIVRDPILSRDIPVTIWIGSIFFLVFGYVISLPVIGKYNRLLIYWL